MPQRVSLYITVQIDTLLLPSVATTSFVADGAFAFVRGSIMSFGCDNFIILSLHCSLAFTFIILYSFSIFTIAFLHAQKDDGRSNSATVLKRFFLGGSGLLSRDFFYKHVLSKSKYIKCKFQIECGYHMTPFVVPSLQFRRRCRVD